MNTIDSDIIWLLVLSALYIFFFNICIDVTIKRTTCNLPKYIFPFYK